MENQTPKTLLEHFSAIDDPRIDRTKRHKLNEITAIPELLRVLEVAGCIVTIDAMGCQTDIAAKIVEKGADYVLAVKGNQNHLFEDIVGYFDWALSNKFNETTYTTDETVDGDHGRVEVRRCYASDDMA